MSQSLPGGGGLPARIAIALAQGGVLWWLYRSLDLDLWPGTDHAWLVGLATPAVLVPVAHYLTDDIAPDRRRLWILPLLALALFGFGWHYGDWTSNEPYEEFFSYALAIFVLVFHALPFVQVWLAHRRWRPRYEELFHFAWRNALLAAFGGLFCGVFWMLLWLWGELFKMIGIDFFADLFDEAYFAIPATTVAVGVGMQLAGSVERLQNVLRNTLLTMLKWLAPLAIFILAIFTLALIFKSPDLLLEQRRVIRAVWLLWLAALTVALLNTAYQDGKAEAPYPHWLGQAIRFCVPLLLPVALLAAYALWVRVDAYGLSVARAWAYLVAFVAIAYAGGYSWAALGRGPWMERMGAVNIGVALISVLSLSLMLSPLLSPERLAANSQYARALDRQEESSFSYLRFDSGEYGRARLRELAAIENQPKAAAIREAAERALKREYRWYGSDFRDEHSAKDFHAFPAGKSVDEGLVAALNGDVAEPHRWACDPTDPCPLLFVDVDRDGTDEALLFGNTVTRIFQLQAGAWRLLPKQLPGYGHERKEQRKFKEALAAGDYVIRDPMWQVLEIRGRVFDFETPSAPVDATEPAVE